MSKIHSYPKVFPVGSDFIPDLFKGPIEVTEKIDGCVTVGHHILLSTLEYIPAENLKTGDEVIGFDESLNNPKLKKSVITHTSILEKECCVVTTNKTRITVSFDHPFLVRDIKRKVKGYSKYWKNASELKPGDRIVSIGRWDFHDTWDSGYLAGQFDGEGSLVRSGGTRALTYYQKEGPELDLVETLLKNEGFIITKTLRRRRKDWKVSGCLKINNGWIEQLRFLGMVRPNRLLSDAEKLWVNAPLNATNDETVREVVPAGNLRVVGLSTSTHTYITEGLLSHNSQFNFGVTKDGELVMRSKGKELFQESYEKMFGIAVNWVLNNEEKIKALGNDTYYYGEFLGTPSHNVLKYERTPKNNIILFGVLKGEGFVKTYDELKDWAGKLDLEAVPLLYYGEIKSFEELNQFMDINSLLGNEKVEGVVVKNYLSPCILGNLVLPSFGKYVREDFKERHATEWGTKFSRTSKLQAWIDSFRTEARFQKAVQHLKEKGELVNEPKDIGKLLEEIERDLLEEERENIKNELYKLFKDSIVRKAKAGFPEYYKEELAKRAFSKSDDQ